MIKLFYKIEICECGFVSLLAENIANIYIRTIRKYFDTNDKGRCIFLTSEKLKNCTKSYIGITSSAEIIQIKHLTSQIELINEQISEIGKK